MTPTPDLSRLVSRLKLDDAVETDARHLYASAANEWQDFYDEDALGAAAVYVASVVRGVECSQPKLARIVAVADRVLDRHVAHLLAQADVPIA